MGKLQESMKQKLLIISTIIFLIVSLAFAIEWHKFYVGGPNEQKGDYIFFCLEVNFVINFLYLILVRISLQKYFPLILVLCAPIILCIVSIFFTVFIGSLIGHTEDNKLLTIYLFIQGFCLILFIYPFALGAKIDFLHP